MPPFGKTASRSRAAAAAGTAGPATAGADGPAAAAADAPTFCNVSYTEDDRTNRTLVDVLRARPRQLGEWLRTHAPGPETTAAPFCYRGVFMTTAAAIRRRPALQYEAMRIELTKGANPEAAHFVERAALYLFASL